LPSTTPDHAKGPTASSIAASNAGSTTRSRAAAMSGARKRSRSIPRMRRRMKRCAARAPRPGVFGL